jgi:hypothetical protein
MEPERRTECLDRAHGKYGDLALGRTGSRTHESAISQIT